MYQSPLRSCSLSRVSPHHSPRRTQGGGHPLNSNLQIWLQPNETQASAATLWSHLCLRSAFADLTCLLRNRTREVSVDFQDAQLVRTVQRPELQPRDSSWVSIYVHSLTGGLSRCLGSGRENEREFNHLPRGPGRSEVRSQGSDLALPLLCLLATVHLQEKPERPQETH
jgi:hypothetical protein